MQKNLKSWILSGVVFVLAVLFTVFCGIAIINMTEKGKTAAVLTEEDNESAEEEGDEEAASSSEDSESIAVSEEAASDETVEEETVTYASALSEDALNEILNNYDGTVRNYYASGSRVGSNIAESCIEFEDLFLLNGIDAVVYDDYSTPNAAFTFILVLEYQDITTALLDKLAAQNVHALFFTCQGYAENHPDIINRLIADGHEIGSVGASCPEGGLANFALSDQMNDVLRFDTYMKENFNYEMHKFFCIYDVFSLQQLAMLNQIGYTPVFYSASYMDYDHNAVIDPETYLTAMEEKAHYGVVYSFHTTNTATVEIMDGLITWLREQGYEIVSVE